VTAEQLDEIEKLAEKWRGWGHASEKWAIRLADSALPLVKALREALAIIDHYERKDGPTFQAHLAEAKALKERDEDRAEVERLKESVANLDALYVSRTDALRESEAEVERLREIVAVNDQRLATMHDEKQQEINRLRKLLNPDMPETITEQAASTEQLRR